MDETTSPNLANGGGEGRGLRVRMLNDGMRVLNEVQEFKPHAVALDIGMPGRNGYDIAREGNRVHLLELLAAGPSPSDMTCRAEDIN